MSADIIDLRTRVKRELQAARPSISTRLEHQHLVGLLTRLALERPHAMPVLERIIVDVLTEHIEIGGVR